VRLEFTYARRDLDVDKLARACLDAMSGVAYTDDKQVTHLFASKAKGAEPGVVIQVQALRA